MKNKYRNLIIPEWERLYVNRDALKEYLKITKALQNKVKEIKYKDPSKYSQLKEQLIGDLSLVSKLKSDNSRFIAIFTSELHKLETFILFKYQDLKQKLTALQDQCTLRKLQKEAETSLQEYETKSRILKESLYEFYYQALLFQRYLYLNRLIINNIVLQYQKYTYKEIKRLESLQTQSLFQDVDTLSKIEYKIKGLISNGSKLLINNFYPFDEAHGARSLKKYRDTKVDNVKTLFLFGMFAGIVIVSTTLIFLLRYQGFLDPREPGKLFSALFPCFRGIGLLIIYYWLLCMDQILWIKYSINYKLYLGFNHHFSTVPSVLKRVSFFSALYILLFLVYCFQVEGISPSLSGLDSVSSYFPLILWALFLGYTFIPTRSALNGQGRRWMFRMFYGFLIQHYFSYEGRFTFILDQFITLPTPMRDFEYTVCYYYNMAIGGDSAKCLVKQKIFSDVCMILVFTFKSLHCLSAAKKNKKFYKTNDMWNFFKNLLAVAVVVLSSLTKFDRVSAYIWIFFATSFTLIQYYWELSRDWLFFEEGSKIKFLRNDLAFKDPNVYYILAAVNLLVSSTWAFTVTPLMYQYLNFPNQELFIFILGFMEVCRRFIHNLLKIEKEHICNLRVFKAHRELVYPFARIQVVTSEIERSEFKFRLSSEYAAGPRHSLAYDFKRISMDAVGNFRFSHLPPDALKQLDLMLSQPYDLMFIQQKNDPITAQQRSQNERFLNEISKLS